MKTKEILLRTALASALAVLLLTVRVIAQAPGSEPDWQMRDIGRAGVAGGTKEAGPGALAVSGAGTDIWGGTDGFHFAYQEIDGDVEIIARVDSVEKTHDWAKAGVMIRASLDQTSAHAMMAMSPERGAAFIRRGETAKWSRDDSHQAVRVISREGRLVYQQRGSAGTDKAPDSMAAAALPRWVKLVRRGNVIKAYDSADGLSWEWLGTEAIHLPQKCYVGLAVSSHDASQLCRAVFSGVRVVAAAGVPDAPAAPGTGDGLMGNYYGAMDQTGEVITRIDPIIDFDWGLGSPAAGIDRNGFSVRWEGELEAQYKEPYLIQLVSDDRARLWLNGQLLIDEWYEHGEQASTAVVSLEAGTRYLVRVDYSENRGRALAKLFWSSPSTPRQIIPTSQLYSRFADRDRDGLPDIWETVHGSDPDNAADADLRSAGNEASNRERYRQGIETPGITRNLGNWIGQDVGNVGVSGEAVLVNGSWRIGGSGADIWANGDGFYFVHQRWAGNGELIARIDGQEATDPWAKAGIMIRENLQSDSRHVMLAATPENGVALLVRQRKGGNTIQVPMPAELAGPWLRLVWDGNSVAAFCSADGDHWEWVGTEAMAFEGAIFHAGMAVNSHDNARLGAADFSAVSLAPGSCDCQARIRIGTGTGLLGTYFDGTSGAIVTRIDPSIDFDWDVEAPIEGIGDDHFSVRWDGFLEPQSSETYSLEVASDDGARLWLDGELVIDGWSDRGITRDRARVNLNADRRYAIRLEYFERSGEAIARLLWNSPTIPRQPVPQEQLYSPTHRLQLATEGNDQSGAVGPTVSSGEPQPDLASADLGGGPSQSGTGSPAIPAIHGVRTVKGVHGAAAISMTGQWATDGDVIYALSSRGGLEYDIPVNEGDVYRLEVEATSRNPFDPDRSFKVLFYVDDELIGDALLSDDLTSAGKAHALTPWLGPGVHRFRVFWDNARKGRSIQIHAVRLQTLDGPDQDANGVKDWVEEKLRRENGIDNVPLEVGSVGSRASRSTSGRSRQEVAAPPILHSATSPACLEGRGGYLTMMRASASGVSLEPRNGIGDRWFMDVPLFASRPTDIIVSFQNGGRIQPVRVEWEPTNLLLAQETTIRAGDSLLLTAFLPQITDPVSGRRASPPGSVRIEIDDDLIYAGPASEPFAFRFDRSGTTSVRGIYTQPDGTTTSRITRVQVLACSSIDSPVAWTEHGRVWEWTDLPAEATLEHSDEVVLSKPASGSSNRQFQLKTGKAFEEWILARTGEGGPVLGSTAVQGVAISGVSESGAFYGERYDDGSRLVEIAVIQNRVFPDVTVTLDIIVGGVMFDDGSLRKVLRAEDFDDTGLANVRFIMPPGTQTSNCHVMRAHQGATLIGEY